MNSGQIREPVRLLFVCVENSNRSQMAEAFCKILGGDRFAAYSAGSRPSGRINPRAVVSMRAVGYDLETHRSKSLAELPGGAFRAVVSMGCGDACPSIPAGLREDWQIPDPGAMGPERFDEVRDLIRAKVGDLLSRLGN